MPKKISIIEKRQWLLLFEEGKSESSIAHDKKHNIKTIKKGIEEARMERDAQLARSELLRNALRHHQDQMLVMIQGILSALEVPPVDLQLPPRLLSGAEAKYSNKNELTLALYVEREPAWELFREHLGSGDQLWARLERWRKAMIGHLHARIDLLQKTKTLLESKTGLRLVDEEIEPPFLYSYNVVSLIYREALNTVLGNPPSDLESEITANIDNGEIRYGFGIILANAPGLENTCRDNILATISDLQGLSELTNTASTYKEVEEAIPKLRRAAEEFTLLGVIPGRCRVCRRLGI